jgi:putative flippase GtrA
LNLSEILKKNALFGYLFAAGSGVLVQYFVASFICLRYLGLPFERSVLIGFICSIPVGFILSKIFAFDSKRSGNTQREILKYSVSLILSAFITTKGASFFLTTLKSNFGEGNMVLPIFDYPFNWIGTLAHFSGMGLSFVCNFFIHRYFTFSETGIFDKIFKSKA